MTRRMSDKTVQVPFSPEQHEILHHMARQSGLSLNALIREAIAQLAQTQSINWPDDDRRTWTPPELGDTGT